MKRKIINIDEKKCNGCGECIPSCPEGAIQVIDGKARLVSDLFCDGLGACIGDCPQDAISVEEREAMPYDEALVMGRIVKGGPAVIEAHLKHLRDHNQTAYLETALDYLEKSNIPIPIPYRNQAEPGLSFSGCPGMKPESFNSDLLPADSASALTHWPVQLHLIQPQAQNFRNADIVLSADCCAYSYGSFHRDFLKGRSLMIACPKLDSGTDVYKNKLISLIDEAKINTLTVIIMEVPCCRGLLSLARQALEEAGRRIPLKLIVIGIKGEKLKEEWL
jgi:ferredoxin